MKKLFGKLHLSDIGKYLNFHAMDCNHDEKSQLVSQLVCCVGKHKVSSQQINRLQIHNITYSTIYFRLEEK